MNSYFDAIFHYFSVVYVMQTRLHSIDAQRRQMLEGVRRDFQGLEQQRQQLIAQFRQVSTSS